MSDWRLRPIITSAVLWDGTNHPAVVDGVLQSRFGPQTPKVGDWIVHDVAPDAYIAVSDELFTYLFEPLPVTTYYEPPSTEVRV